MIVEDVELVACDYKYPRHNMSDGCNCGESADFNHSVIGDRKEIRRYCSGISPARYL